MEVHNTLPRNDPDMLDLQGKHDRSHNTGFRHPEAADVLHATNSIRLLRKRY